jgi:hypothetical protein
MKIDDVIAQIQSREPATAYMPVKTEWVNSAARRYPGMPDDLKHFYATYGYGSIGDNRYMIHCLLEAGDIYDAKTAHGLDGILIVGDDFAGHCEAYDAANGWRFGSIGSNGQFEPYDGIYSSFTDFLEKRFVAGDA